jgi:5-oxoprolinase (ATP-hydrolysing) subunit A
LRFGAKSLKNSKAILRITLPAIARMKNRIDLNLDLGESFGIWKMGEDDALLECATSINVACGFHAGDPNVMLRTVERALSYELAIGAHPGLPDKQGFGRREMALSGLEVYGDVLYQLGALSAMATAHDTWLMHVKPHGALYHMAEKDPLIAAAIVRAVKTFDDQLIVVGFSGGQLLSHAQEAGLRVAHEVFADRRYGADGKLLPRTHPDAVILSPAEAAKQAQSMLKQGGVLLPDGRLLSLQVDTICLHGDKAQAVDFAQAVRQAIEACGCTLRSLSFDA